METVYSLADQMMLGTDRAGGIGVACIGPLDSIEGVIESPPYFNGIHDVPLAKLLEERYHLPVFCDNDNQSAALAEKTVRHWPRVSGYLSHRPLQRCGMRDHHRQ